MKVPHLTQAMLKAMLHYDPETGVFTWLRRSDVGPQWNGRYAGKQAGYARKATGGGWYWSVRIFDWPFHAHRLAWLYMTGSWPPAQVDHRDVDGLNNRWTNLRAATRSQNGANLHKPSTNTSGLKGASFDKRRQRWLAVITVNGRRLWLGYHDTAEQAHAAYVAAATAHHGEFARAA